MVWCQMAPSPYLNQCWLNFQLDPQWTIFSVIWIKIQKYSCKKLNSRMSSTKWQPFCFGLNVLNTLLTFCSFSAKSTQNFHEFHVNVPVYFTVHSRLVFHKITMGLSEFPLNAMLYFTAPSRLGFHRIYMRCSWLHHEHHPIFHITFLGPVSLTLFCP